MDHKETNREPLHPEQDPELEMLEMPETERKEKPEGMSDLEWENLCLKEENERLRQLKEEYRRTLPPKEQLYDRIPVSLKTMDRIIAGLIVLLIVVFIIGMLKR